MIFANHAHTFPKEIRENGTVEALKRYMDQCGIDKCVAYSTFIKILRENGVEYNPNRRLYEEIKSFPDIVGFGTVDATADNIEDQIDEIASFNFRGIKVHPQAQQLPLDSKKAFRIYKKCEELGLFISFHSGIHWYRLKDNHVSLFDEVAFHFPNLRFSMEHIGGYSYFNDALAVMVNNKKHGLQPRVYAGWTSIAGTRSAWSINDEQLYALLEQTTENNSIFGLDFPYNNRENTCKAIERIRGLDIPESTKEKILGLNFMQALGMVEPAI